MFQTTNQPLIFHYQRLNHHSITINTPIKSPVFRVIFPIGLMVDRSIISEDIPAGWGPQSSDSVNRCLKKVAEF